MFSERFDFLMQLTNTSNVSLARAISYDQSYISKIRLGKRGMPRHQEFFDQAATYFTRNLTSEYQKKAISDAVMGGSPLPQDKRQLERLLSEWLRESGDADGASVSAFLHGVSGMTRGALEAAAAAHGKAAMASASEVPSPSAIGVLPFYGNEGKRNAVELFLSRLCATGQAHTLLLCSDEDMSWLYEDEAFARRWAALLAKILSLGGSIKMIHTVSRNVSELLDAVQKWMPLYLTGRIEPYFFPRLRDGVYRRSLFVAQGHSALVSNSVLTGTQGMANLLFDEPAVVGALESEFWNYFALCRPLMSIYRTPHEAKALRSDIQRLESGGGSLYFANALPSFYTMPKAVLSHMTQSEMLEKFRAESSAAFRARLKSGAQVVELLNLPEPSAVDAGQAMLPMCSIVGIPQLAYDRKLLIQHLSAVQRLTEQHGNYHVVLTGHIPAELLILASEHAGAMLLCPLPAVFSMTEQNISTALLEYLSRAAEAARERSGDTLAGYIKALQTSKS